MGIPFLAFLLLLLYIDSVWCGELYTKERPDSEKYDLPVALLSFKMPTDAGMNSVSSAISISTGSAIMSTHDKPAQ